MPRIPVRTEPYSSPSRQHRHFKNKRDQILRALGKSSYINGSQFAIIWVTASGQSEIYASDAFQGSLEDWFDKSGIQEQAKSIVQQRSGQVSKAPVELDDDDDSRDVFTDDECDENSVREGSVSRRSSLMPTNESIGRKLPTPLITCDDVFGNPTIPASSETPSSSKAATSALPAMAAAVEAASDLSSLSRSLKTDAGASGSSLSVSRLSRKPLAPLDINSANLRFNSIAKGTLPPPVSASDDAFLRGPLSAPLPQQPTGHKFRRSQLGRVPSTISPLNNLTDVLLVDRAARTAFFELRFSQMQQGMCKTVAKAWIKIIEPKKQTRCPYNKGEEGKPEWWPAGVRHKEPDHLMKPERHSLLLAILRSPKIKVSRLQLATAEVVAMIKADKVNLLMDVYRVAREEERFREEGQGDAQDIPITVGVSTLEGWRVGRDGERGGLNEEGKLATIAEDSPEDAERKNKKSLKRPAASQSPKIALNSLGVPQSSGRKSSKLSRTQGPQASGSKLQEIVRMPKTGPTFSLQPNHSQSASNLRVLPASNNGFSNPTSFHDSPAIGPSYQVDPRSRLYDSHVQAYLPSGSPMIDLQHSNSVTPIMHQGAGSMSAPQAPHVHLFPPQPHSSSSFSADSSPAISQYGFGFNGNFVNPFEPSNVHARTAGELVYTQPNPSPFMPQALPPHMQTASALGLEGVTADHSLWTQAFEASNPGALAPGGGSYWNVMDQGAGELPSQQDQLLRSPFDGENPASAPARLTPLPVMTTADESIGDSTMDHSFASATTTGPATPPGEARGLGISATGNFNDLSHPSKSHTMTESMPRFEYSALAAGMYSNGPRRDVHNQSFDAWTAAGN